MSTTRTYGLAACVWRRLRAKHPGVVPALTLYGRDGSVLGDAFLFRYEACVGIPAHLSFSDISWKTTIECAPVETGGLLGPSKIAIGETRWG